jgi:ribosome modulation factor
MNKGNDMQEIFNEGYAARMRHLYLSACPHAEGSEEARIWANGWRKACREILKNNS